MCSIDYDQHMAVVGMCPVLILRKEKIELAGLGRLAIALFSFRGKRIFTCKERFDSLALVASACSESIFFREKKYVRSLAGRPRVGSASA